MRCAVLILLAASSMSAGLLVTLPEAQAPVDTPLNGLTVTSIGESFTFSDPGKNVLYNVTVPGTQNYITDPAIVGFAPDQFSVTFSSPVDYIQFGFAEGITLPPVEVDGVGVNLYDGATPILATSFNLLPDGNPAEEAQFTWTAIPGQEVTTLVVTPVSITASPEIFGFGNATVDVVPEPGSISMLALGLAAGLLVFRRRWINH